MTEHIEHIEHPHHVAPDTTNPGRTTCDLSPFGELISHRFLDGVDGHPPVPIDIWRVADDKPADDHHAHVQTTTPQTPPEEITQGWQCTTRMAQLLIGMFTIPGAAVVSVGFDPVLAGAATAVGCHYQTVKRIADLPTLGHLTGRVGLLLVPWPDTSPRGNTSDVGNISANLGAYDTCDTPRDMCDTGRGADWLTACRTLMTDRGVTVVILASPTTDAYVACARLLLPAARRAGFGWLHHIVAITTPIAGRDLNSTEPSVVSPPSATPPRTPMGWSDGESGRDNLRSVPVPADLLAFVLRRDRHGRPVSTTCP